MNDPGDEDAKNILAVAASVCTIIHFLTGLFICRKIIRDKSSIFISSFPFISGCLSTSLWLTYGFLISNVYITLVNAVGVTLFSFYTAIYFLYSTKKAVVVHRLLASVLFLICTLLLVHCVEDNELAISYFGLTCCLTNIWFFVAPLSSLFHGIKVKSSEGLSYYMIVFTFIVSLLWMIYGMLLKDTFIQIPNFLGCLLSGFQLNLFLMYPDTRQSKANSASNI